MKHTPDCPGTEKRDPEDCYCTYNHRDGCINSNGVTIENVRACYCQKWAKETIEEMVGLYPNYRETRRQNTPKTNTKSTITVVQEATHKDGCINSYGYSKRSTSSCYCQNWDNKSIEYNKRAFPDWKNKVIKNTPPDCPSTGTNSCSEQTLGTEPPNPFKEKETTKEMAKGQIYQIAILHTPTPTRAQIENNVIPPNVLLGEITTVVANSLDEAKMIAARLIPESHKDRLSEIQPIVRPFGA